MVGRSARACGEAFADFIEQLDWGHVSYFDVSSLPGETAHLVYQTDARNSVSTWNGQLQLGNLAPRRGDGFGQTDCNGGVVLMAFANVTLMRL